MREFTGKTAVVTGAASGIGMELARLFAEQGMNLVLADIEEKALENSLASLQTLGGEAIAVVTDVSKAEAVDSLAEAAIERFGQVDIVCNNAGVFTGGSIWETSVDDYQWLINVNQWGVINGIRSFVPRMIAQATPGHIVNVASMAGLTSVPFVAAYNMTKHAVVSLSECLYHELALSAPQIQVSCLCPEAVTTNIDRANRNRPTAFETREPSEVQRMIQKSHTDSTRAGISPSELAERTLAAIKEGQFYILPPEESDWSKLAELRLDDIRTRRNPSPPT
jgi:short-subunit dehydrogenase